MAELMQYLTPIVAVAAFILSAIIWLERLRLRKPRLDVYAVCKKLQHYGWHSEGCELSVQNTGVVDTTLCSLHFEIRTESKKGNCGRGHQTLTKLKFFGGTSLPHKLCARESCIVLVPGRGMAEGLMDIGYRGVVELRACYEDQLGKKYKSNKFRFNIDYYITTPFQVAYDRIPID